MPAREGRTMRFSRFCRRNYVFVDFIANLCFTSIKKYMKSEWEEGFLYLISILFIMNFFFSK